MNAKRATDITVLALEAQYGTELITGIYHKITMAAAAGKTYAELPYTNSRVLEALLALQGFTVKLSQLDNSYLVTWGEAPDAR
jgi:hypothetical protein